MFCEISKFGKNPVWELNPTEQRIFESLDEQKITYEGVHHPQADTMEACAQIEVELGAPICKNLFLCNRQETEFYLLMMPREKPFKTKYLSSQLGCSRLSFGSAENMAALLRTIPGSVSFLELLFDTQQKIRLVVDQELMEDSHIGAHPGLSVSTLKIKTEDFLTYVQHTGHSITYVTLPEQFSEE